MKTKSIVLCALSLIALPTMAHADPTTSPQNSAGYGVTNLDGIDNPFSAGKLSAGKLDIKPHQVTIQGGYLRNDNGQQGATISLDLDKKYLVDGTIHNDGASGFMINPALHGRLDVFGKDGEGKQVKADLEISGIALMYGQSDSRDRYAETMHALDAKSVINEAASISFDHWENCQVDGGSSSATHCYDGMPTDRSTWTEAQRQEIAKRQMPMYNVSMKPSTTGEVVLLSVSGVYQRSPLVKAETIGGKLQVLKLAGETSFRIGKQVQVDMCASGVGSLIVGQTRVGEERSGGAWQTKVSACAGVQIGKLGRIGYEAGYSHQYNFDGSTIQSVAQTVSLSKIANSPVKAGWTNEIEASNLDGGKSVGGVTTNLFTVGAAF